MSSPWRVVFDWVVIALSALAAIPLALLRPPNEVVRRWISVAVAWMARVPKLGAWHSPLSVKR